MIEAAYPGWLALAVLAVAFLYASVGHAGASGYIAVMTLSGLSLAFIKPTALTLNILVASIGSFQFWRAGYFSWKLFWPFALASLPWAYFGGSLHVPGELLKPVLGAVLWLSAARLFFKPGDGGEIRAPGKGTALSVGAGIGFLAGITGTGGGIFLTPLLLLRRWARIKNAAAVSAVFILVNSASGLAGYLASGKSVPHSAWLLISAAVLGGAFGSYFGSRKFPVRVIQVLLAAVLIIAGAKLIFTRESLFGQSAPLSSRENPVS